MGETRVDLLRLLEDLRDADTGTVEEMTLTGIVANALDSGAAEVSTATDSAFQTLAVVDDGKRMGRHGTLRRAGGSRRISVWTRGRWTSRPCGG